MKIKKGDNVKILTGKDKGKTGKVIKTFPKENLILVENINLHIRHRRSRKQGQKGDRVRVAMPIHASNVAVMCSSCNRAVRVGYRVGENNKVRVCKRCGSEL